MNNFFNIDIFLQWYTENPELPDVCKVIHYMAIYGLTLYLLLQDWEGEEPP